MAKRSEDTISDTDVLQAPPITRMQTVSTPKVEVESRIFLLSNDKRQGKVSLDMEEDVIDPKTGAVRRMRLLRGAQSIWFDEQNPNVFPKSYVDKNILTLEFDRGVCIIPINQPLKLQAAELTNRNMATKKKNGAMARPKDIYFYEWNPIEQNRLEIEEENNVIEAMQIAMTAKYADMVPHAGYLNIQFADEMGVPLDENALRAMYVRKAKNESKKFLSSITSPIVKVNYMVRKAIETGKIDLGRQPGTAWWVDGGFIATLPQERDAVEYLVEFASIQGEANAAFANQLRVLTS